MRIRNMQRTLRINAFSCRSDHTIERCSIVRIGVIVLDNVLPQHMGMSVEVLIKNAASDCGEGPHWDDKTKTILFVDFGEKTVHRLNYATGEDEIKHFDDRVSFIVPRRSGGYMIGHGKALSHADWDSNVVTTLAEVVEPWNNTRFNDGECDASGRLWAGTLAEANALGVREPARGSLYSLNKDHKITKHEDKITLSNGMDWTADNKTMFYIDSEARQVWGYDFDVDAGSISNKRTVVDFGGAETMDTLGVPDGMTIDNNGHIWVTCYGVGKVVCFDPETGKSIRTVEFPEAKKTTSCCFGGPNMDELFVTSGTFNLTPEQVRNEQPLAGSLFRVTGLGVKGKHANVYEG
ncbi:hypothetical protein ScPMuIL_001727 [Solemya velum]